MNGSVCLLVSIVVLAGIIVLLVKYIRMSSYHGQGNSKLIGRTGFVIRSSQFDGDMRVEVGGENWLARSESRHVFKTGDKIVIRNIESDEMVLLVELEDK